MSGVDDMIETQLAQRGIHDGRVLEAMRNIPREKFVPENLRGDSYIDAPVPIGFGQTHHAAVYDRADGAIAELTGDEKVLEVGTGSGYHAAVLGALARQVISIERIPELVVMARANLQRTGLDGNITVVCGRWIAGGSGRGAVRRDLGGSSLAHRRRRRWSGS